MRYFIIPVSAVLLLSSVLFGCTSRESEHYREVRKMFDDSAQAFNLHDFEAYAAYYTEDMQWDIASMPDLIPKKDFIASLASRPADDPNQRHFQKTILVAGDWVFMDECSFVGTNKNSGKVFRTFHADLVHLDGLKIRKMTTYSDGTVSGVALGLYEPAIPQPPLPPLRRWPTAEPSPTGLRGPEAQKDFLNRWNSHDPDYLAKILDHGAAILISPLFSVTDRESFIAWWELMLQSFPDLNMRENMGRDMGNGWVFSEVQLSGTHYGSYLRFDPTGKTFSLRTAVAAKYTDQGLLENLRLYFDSKLLMDQLQLPLTPLPSENRKTL